MAASRAGDPSFLAPMLAQPLRMPDEARHLTGDWVYERKLDGLRCESVRAGLRVELWSRNHLSFDHRFPDIAAALATLPIDSFVLDGEIAAFDGERSSFELLQTASPTARRVYVVFDVLFLLGQDTTGLPLRDRSELLKRVLGDSHPKLRLSDQFTGEPGDLLARACRSGWEGLVAKRASAPYRPGRSPDWRKLKCSARQELVIGGWSDPSGARTGFGALLMGYFDRGGLRYAGKVGTGFDEPTLRQLLVQLRSRTVPESPFADQVRLKGVHWVRPDLVAEIEFTEWTRDGRMRHPRYLGLRPDKDATDVHRELLPPNPLGGPSNR
ncbi:MAG: non-homologous end-joining DNA ligase [Acidimicrobiales bacterium]|nr:non-homologous end-joining DNA ligase [Acidimicrobiales bacterium]